MSTELGVEVGMPAEVGVEQGGGRGQSFHQHQQRERSLDSPVPLTV